MGETLTPVKVTLYMSSSERTLWACFVLDFASQATCMLPYLIAGVLWCFTGRASAINHVIDLLIYSYSVIDQR